MTPTSTESQAGGAPQTLTPLGKNLRYAMAGAYCCMATHAVMVPVDVVKTRIQIAPEGVYTSMKDAFIKISRQEGLRALGTGFIPTSLGYACQGACKFGFYELFKNTVASAVGDDAAAKYKSLIYMGSAAAAETLASFALCPFEAVRIRMVSDMNFPRAFIPAVSAIARTEGLIGFYKGLTPIMMKQVPYTVVQLVSFQTAVEMIYKSLDKLAHKKKEDLSTGAQLTVSTVGGIMAGVTSAVASHPADTVLSRINATERLGNESTLGTITRIVKELGWRRVWLGIGPRCVMVGALSAGMFLIYDSVKVACGLPTTTGLGDNNNKDNNKSSDTAATATAVSTN